MLKKPNQKGFVVISVLLVTTISTMLAVSAIGENRLQERISGNQVKELNARSEAELGVFDTYRYIQDNSTLSLSELNAAVPGRSISDQYTLSSSIDGSTLIITSEGLYRGAVAHLQAHILVDNSEGGTSPGGVVACNSITLAGSGKIDSYDSREGEYDANDANSEARVIAIEGDLNLTGNTAIYGDSTVNGNVTTVGSATFGGDLSASGNITLAQTQVNGSVSSGGNVSLTGGTVGDGSSGSGAVSATGDLTLGWSTYTKGENGSATGEVNVNGSINPPGNDYNTDDFSTNITQSGATAPIMASNSCNEKKVETAFPTEIASTDISAQMDSENRNNGGTQTALLFSETSAQVFDGSGGTTEISPSAQESTLWDGEENIYVFDDFDLNNTMITVSGDVTIMVKGNLTTAGGSTGFQFAEGDTTSSLTVLVEGTTSIGSSVNVFTGATVDSDGEVPFTLYSSYDSGDTATNAVYMNGATDMYAKVYAPLGNVEYAASGEMTGSLEGKNVNVSGHGDIHYDQALADIDPDDPDLDDSVKMASIYYYYPNN